MAPERERLPGLHQRPERGGGRAGPGQLHAPHRPRADPRSRRRTGAGGQGRRRRHRPGEPLGLRPVALRPRRRRGAAAPLTVAGAQQRAVGGGCRSG